MNDHSADEDSNVFDMDDLLARCLGNVEFVQRVLTKFQERCDEDLMALEQAMIRADTELVARLAHRLKGASANASALRLREHAAAIEDAARRRTLGAVPDRLGELRHEWGRFTAAVARLEPPAMCAIQPLESS